jgi:hypothetical protein
MALPPQDLADAIAAERGGQLTNEILQGLRKMFQQRGAA